MYASYHIDIKVPMTLCQVTPPAVFSSHSFHFQKLNLNNVDLKIAGLGKKKRKREMLGTYQHYKHCTIHA